MNDPYAYNNPTVQDLARTASIESFLNSDASGFGWSFSEWPKWVQQAVLNPAKQRNDRLGLMSFFLWNGMREQLAVDIVLMVDVRLHLTYSQNDPDHLYPRDDYVIIRSKYYDKSALTDTLGMLPQHHSGKLYTLRPAGTYDMRLRRMIRLPGSQEQGLYPPGTVLEKLPGGAWRPVQEDEEEIDIIN